MAGNATVVGHMRSIGKICRDTFGVKVVELAGWTTRGRSSTFAPRFTIEHHTAAPVDITAMLINGRPDLSGPLCNFELRKDGTVGLLASGRANHAGVASVSSTESYGIEATGPVPTGNTGADAFPQYKQYVALVAAICLHHGWGMDRVKAHKEIAPTRKVDPFFDMDAFRSQVTAAMAGKTIEQEWWTVSIPAAELQKIEAQAVQALQSDSGRVAIRQAVWEALGNPLPFESKGGSVAFRVGLLHPKLDVMVANQQTGLANQQMFVTVIPDLTGGGGGTLTDEQVAAVAVAIAAQLREAGLPDEVVAALVRELTD